MKRFFVFFPFFFLSLKIFSFTADDIKIFILENGLKIYFLEDSSSPAVRAELSVNAGFTCQGPENGGLFTMYARLIGGEMSNDSVRFVEKAAPAAIERAILSLSEKLRPLSVSDSELSSISKDMAAEFREYSGGTAGYINSAIDSKIFSKNPWSRESGVSPKTFNARKIEELRAGLLSLHAKYYVPSNSALFINGNITESAALELAKKYFLRFAAPSFDESAPVEDGRILPGRKFVLYHKNFSDEMTQIVVQYTNLGRDEADALSCGWNQDSSEFKKLLLKQRNLKILGGEYIDVSSAQEKNSSRLIIQSLLGKAAVSPAVQADLFLTMSRDEDVFSESDLDRALRDEETAFVRLSEDSDAMMERLSRSLSISGSSEPIKNFFQKNERLAEIEISSLQEKIVGEEPYVFVLLNSSVYQKCSSEFKKMGFVEIPEKESAWYNQAAYKNFLSGEAGERARNAELLEEIALSARRFISKNLSEFSSFTLGNGIPVTVKRSENSNTTVLSVIVAGGELLFTDKVPGLSSVLTNCIAVNIKKQLDLFASNGAARGFYEVSSRTLSTHSIISVTCLSDELDLAVRAAYTALVYRDISPAMADGVTYDERTQWRIKSGSAEFQLLCEAARLLYEGTDYPKLYADGEDRPGQKLDFNHIQEAYPVLLDSTRFSLIFSGGVKSLESLRRTLDETFGALGSIEETRSDASRVRAPDFDGLSERERRVSLRHLFLTDISKENAGPMPKVLVPTTKFLDPLLYCLASPDLSSTDRALFDSILIELASRIEKKLSEKYPGEKVRAALPDNDIPFARILVTGVEHTDEVDSVYSECVSSIKNDISRQIEIRTDGVIDLEKTGLLANFENNWLMTVISKAGSQKGTARLMQDGEAQGNPKLYLLQYEAVSDAGLEDYNRIVEKYFDSKAPLAIYSKDSPK